MKKSQFSERLYETLINHLFLSRGFDIYVPSQNKEAALGYDALFQNGKRKIGMFQYKIIKEYERKPIYHNSADHAYAFNLHGPKNKSYEQHNNLFKRMNRGIICGYVVPCFIEYKELFSYYHNTNSNNNNNCNNEALLDHSLLIKPTVKITDNNYHYITFDNKIAYLHSKEKIQLEIQSLSEFIGSIKESKDYSKETFTNEFLEGFIDYNEFDENLKDNEKINKILYDNKIILVAYKAD